MSEYDRQRERLERRRRFAEYLMATGGPGPGQQQGRIYAPSSTLSVLTPLVAAYGAKRIEREGERLDKRQKSEQEAANRELIDTLTAPEQPTKIDQSGAPIPGTAVPRILDPETGTPALSPQGERLASVLRGADPEQGGGMLRAAALSRMFKEQEPYTLGPGQRRFEGSRQVAAVPDKPEGYTLGKDQVRFEGNREIARGPAGGPDSDDRQLVNVVDPRAPKGYRTIKRADWKGEQLMHFAGGDGEDADEFNASDANSFASQAAAMYGGFYNPVTQTFSGLNRDTAEQANNLAALAARIWIESGKKIAHNEAVQLALREMKAQKPEPATPNAAGVLPGDTDYIYTPGEGLRKTR